MTVFNTVLLTTITFLMGVVGYSLCLDTEPLVQGWLGVGIISLLPLATYALGYFYRGAQHGND